MNIYIETYGCTSNKSDESIIKSFLLSNSYKITKNIDLANIIIIITCTVINTTEQKMLSRFRLLKKSKKKIIVTGCMASAQYNLIKSILPDSIILPPSYIHYIVNVINGEKEIDYKLIDKSKFDKIFEGITGSISISEGCNYSCSYCITTIARGKLRCFPINEIKKDINSALKQGCREIQLTSQDTSSYEIGSKINLGSLLRSIVKIDDNFRIRIGMMNPYSVLQHLNSIISGFDNNKIYKFLHIPVQSGDNDILKNMNRKYSIEDFLKIVKSFRQKYPKITLSTDIIVGFPSETEEQFNRSINLIKKIKPDILNITRFSSRPKTKAKNLSGRLRTEIVKERSKLLSKISKEISKNINENYIGKIYEVLAIEFGKNNTILCRTDNYKPVIIKNTVRLGEFVKVEITNSKHNYLVGTII